jgi:hypothetical protein
VVCSWGHRGGAFRFRFTRVLTNSNSVKCVTPLHTSVRGVIGVVPSCSMVRAVWGRGW